MPKKDKTPQLNDTDHNAISPEGIKAFLSRETAGITIYKSLPSTNQTAKQLALDGAESGSVIIANEQTAGRGRMGKSFFSPSNSGIYMSVILRPPFPAVELITPLTSVAVCRAIENTLEYTPKIKWVNDILLNGKKVCGILTEAVTESDGIAFVILGIGINFSTEIFPNDLQNTAGSLQIPLSTTITRNELIAEILKQLFSCLSDGDTTDIMQEYRKRSIVLGKEIEVICNSEVTHAIAIDIDKNGGLVVRLSDGTEQTLISGEISIRGVWDEK